MNADEAKAPSSAIAVTVHSFENNIEHPYSGTAQVILSVDKQNPAEVVLDQPTNVALPSGARQLQFLVRAGEQVLGSVSLSLQELATLKAQSRKHWVTLFDDEDDNVYDGDYAEDDADVPRILVSYQLAAAEPAKEEKKVEAETAKKITPFDTTLVDSQDRSAEKPAKQEKELSIPAPQPEKKETPQQETCHELVQTGAENVVITCSVIPDTTKAETAVVPQIEPSKIVGSPAPTVEAETASPHFGVSENIVESPAVVNALPDRSEVKSEPNAPVTSPAAEHGDRTNELIVMLTEQNKKLRTELHGMEDEKACILSKLQTEVQDYDSQISVLLKDKFELKERLASAEGKLAESAAESQARAEEAKKCKETSGAEVKTKEQVVAHRVAQYEAQIAELRQQVTVLKTSVEETAEKKMAPVSVPQSGAAERMKEIEGQYVQQIKDVQARLEESEKMRAEAAGELKVMKAKAKEDAEMMRKLGEERDSLRTQCEGLSGELKEATRRRDDAEKKQAEFEQKANSELADLLQKNIALVSKLEQMTQTVSDLTAEKESLRTTLSQKLQETTATQQQSALQLTMAKSEAEFLTSELESKTKLWETERQNMAADLASAQQRLGEVSALQKTLQAEVLGKQKAEEELAEKCRVVKSLNDLIEQYKAELLALRKRLEELEAEFAKLKREKEEMGVEHGNTVKVVNVYEEKIKKIAQELTQANTRLQERQKELAEKETKVRTGEEELDSLRSQLKEQQTRIADYETQEKKRSERLDDIAQRTKDTEKEIETLRLRSKTKEEKLQDASVKLMQKSKQLREMETQCYQQQEELNSLKATLKKCLDETEQLRKDLILSRKEVDDLKALLGTYKKMAGEESKEGHVIYTPDNTDRVDQMFAFYINETKCPVMLKKIGEGQYMFGTKKIFAKIQNEKLVIRVGGGYMMIDEFLSVYTAQELAKMQRAAESAGPAAEGEAGSANSSAQKYNGSFVKSLFACLTKVI